MYVLCFCVEGKKNIAYQICNVSYFPSARDKVHFENLNWTKSKVVYFEKLEWKSLFFWMPFYLA